MRILVIISVFIVSFVFVFSIFLYNWMTELEEIGGELYSHPVPFTYILTSFLLSIGVTKFFNSKIWKKKDDSKPLIKK